MNVSVIIPVYNAEKTIINALESVINQTVKVFEIILVDDGCSDNSYNIITNYINENPSFRFKVIRQLNGGVSSARNAGLKIAEGDVIALLDSDDEWFLDKLEIQLGVLKDNSSYYLLGALTNKPKSQAQKLIDITVSQLIFKNYFQPSTVIFKKDIIDQIGYFDQSQKYAEEGNYFIRVANSFRCGLINYQLVLYDKGKRGFGERGLSSNLIEMERGELKNLKYAYKNNYITFFTYLLAVVYSIIKYFRRIFIVKFS